MINLGPVEAMVVLLIVSALVIWPTWRICSKAGLPGALSFLRRFRDIPVSSSSLTAGIWSACPRIAVPHERRARAYHQFLFLVLAAVLFAGCPPFVRAQAKPGPKSKPHHLSVYIDVSEAPETAEWSKKAKEVVIKWYPRIAKLLETDGFAPPTKVELVVKKNMGLKVPGVTSGNRISISSEHVAKHPDDFGMLIHELTHVIQQYPHSTIKRGWVTEGIADYVRFFHYQPGPAIGRFRPDKAKFTDGYRTTARFLAWIENTHDKKIVKTLNRACRHGQYRPEIFQQATSKSLDQLWDEFIANAKGKQAESKQKRGSRIVARHLWAPLMRKIAHSWCTFGITA